MSNAYQYSESIIFGANEVAKIIGITVAQVAQIGQFISPQMPANGKGYRIGYSYKNIVEVCIVLYLMKFGVPRKRIQKYLNDLNSSRMRWLDEDGNNGWIMLDDQWRWSAAYSPNEAIEALYNSGIVHAGITIDLNLIKQTISKKIEELGGVEKNGRRLAIAGAVS